MQSLKKKKWFITILSLLTMISCFSVGFATWELTGGVVARVEGTIDSDNYKDNSRGIDCFNNIGIELSSRPYLSMSSENGFLRSDNSFSYTSEKLTFSADFLLSTAKPIVTSLMNGGNTCTFVIGIIVGSYAFSSSSTSFILVSAVNSSKITFGTPTRAKDSDENTLYNKYDVATTINNSNITDTSITFYFEVRFEAPSQTEYKKFFVEMKKSFRITIFVR